MTTSRLTLAVVVLCLSATGFVPQDRRHEVARLRAHFDSVDAELRASNPLRWTPAQSTNRLRLIGWLREYRDAGRFPLNDLFPTKAMPFFRDSRGVLCAMAYLIDRSGRGDLVDRVASSQNNAYIPELVGDPELRAWLDSVGLSVAEAARIQPTYEPPPDDSETDRSVSTGYALTSILVSGSSLATVGFNLFDPSRSAGWAGLVAGGVGILAGAANIDEAGETDDVAVANMLAGGGALAVGVYRLLTPPQAGVVDVSPMVIPTSRNPRVGLAVHASF
jgi:hypothetical protein